MIKARRKYHTTIIPCLSHPARAGLIYRIYNIFYKHIHINTHVHTHIHTDGRARKNSSNRSFHKVSLAAITENAQHSLSLYSVNKSQLYQLYAARTHTNNRPREEAQCSPWQITSFTRFVYKTMLNAGFPLCLPSVSKITQNSSLSIHGIAARKIVVNSAKTTCTRRVRSNKSVNRACIV